ncbi:MAG TPA: VWA domain-containing protein, partial [Chloroflexota bacterium]
VILFGRDAVVERPASPVRELSPFRSQPEGDRTNLAAALRLGLTSLPNTAARRLVVLSDGNENLEQAREQARIVGGAGVPIAVVPLPAYGGAEVLVRQLDVPTLLHEDERFVVRVTLEASHEGVADVRLVVDGRQVATQTARLHAGSNVLLFSQEPLPPGFHQIEAHVESGNDRLVENNRAVGFTTVTGRPSVLLVEGQEGEGASLEAALTSAGVTVTRQRVQSAPSDVASLRGYQSVVLANVPYGDIAPPFMQALRTYVETFGGGLVVIGGPNSFGVGGYHRTPLEEMLPVRMDLPGQRVSASTALILVIDTSGSMASGPSGTSKLELAKEAAMSAAEYLGQQDQLGILAFEDSPRWVRTLEPVTDLAEVQRVVSAMAPGGGTNVYAALDAAYLAMAGVEAKVKHILLLTDGLTPPADWERLVGRMRDRQITLSTLAIGSDADGNLLRHLAALGEGRFHATNDPFDVPQLVVKETQEVARAALVEEQFRVQPGPADHGQLGIDLEAAPPLLGYVATSPKTSAQISLLTPQGDPLLAEWQYGLGRVVAWTSDARNRWASSWLGWPGFGQFWAQVIKRAAARSLDPNRQVTVSMEENEAVVRIDVVGDDRRYENFLDTVAVVVGPDGAQEEVPMPQVGPGRYEGRFPVGEQGAYAIQVVQRNEAGEVVANQPTGLAVPYSPEYRLLGGDARLLAELVRSTGGAVITAPEESFSRQGTSGGQPRLLSPWLLAAAAVLFLADVASRRLRLRLAVPAPVRGFVQRIWSRRPRGPSVAATRLATARLRGLSAIAGGRPRTHPRAAAGGVAALRLVPKERAVAPARPRPRATPSAAPAGDQAAAAPLPVDRPPREAVDQSSGDRASADKGATPRQRLLAAKQRVGRR